MGRVVYCAAFTPGRPHVEDVDSGPLAAKSKMLSLEEIRRTHEWGDLYQSDRIWVLRDTEWSRNCGCKYREILGTVELYREGKY